MLPWLFGSDTHRADCICNDCHKHRKDLELIERMGKWDRKKNPQHLSECICKECINKVQHDAHTFTYQTRGSPEDLLSWRDNTLDAVEEALEEGRRQPVGARIMVSTAMDAALATLQKYAEDNRTHDRVYNHGVCTPHTKALFVLLEELREEAQRRFETLFPNPAKG